MNDRYYAFSKGRKRGPFSLDDLLDETERDQINYEDLCLRIGSTTCERIRDVLDWEDKHLILTPGIKDEYIPEQEEDAPDHDEVDELEFIDDDDGDLDDEESYETLDDDPEEATPEDEEEGYDELKPKEADDTKEDNTPDSDEFEYSEESGEHEELEEFEETSPPPQNRPPRDSTAILYSGRPSLLSFPKSLFLVALSLGAGIWLRSQFEWILLAGIALALITFILAQLRRARHRYYITPKQVEVIHGLILNNSREIRIEDIGAIHIRQRGLQGLLGLASIEFAAIDSPMPVLVFYNIRSPRRIKDLIRRLQDALEYEG